MIESQGGTPEAGGPRRPMRPESQTKWERLSGHPLLLTALTFGLGILLTIVVATLDKDLRYLLWLSLPCLVISWWVIVDILLVGRIKWLSLTALCLLTCGGLYWLNIYLPSPTTASNIENKIREWCWEYGYNLEIQDNPNPMDSFVATLHIMPSDPSRMVKIEHAKGFPDAVMFFVLGKRPEIQQRLAALSAEEKQVLISKINIAMEPIRATGIDAHPDQSLVTIQILRQVPVKALTRENFGQYVIQTGGAGVVYYNTIQLSLPPEPQAQVKPK